MNRTFVLLLLFCVQLPLVAQTVVVWDFATRDGRKTDTTASLTAEFEEALSQKGKYAVLERRSFDRLRAVIANEKALQDIGEISSAGSTELRKLGVSVVIFGEMYDDVESGEVSITVTFQDFKGQKLLIKSVLMRRGLLRDAASRRERLAALVDGITGVTAPSTNSSVKGGRVQQNDFIFDLQGCSLSDRTVLCRFLITNNGEDRKLFIVVSRKYGITFDSFSVNSGTGTLIYDDFNNEAAPTRIQLSNASGDSNQLAVGATLISGRPAEATIRFEGLSSKATTVARLDVICVDTESKSVFAAKFRNIPLGR